MDHGAVPSAAGDARAATRARLPASVIALGVTSFFTDVGSEMIFPLLPAFVATLGAGAAFLGVLEGLADAVSSLLKLASGYAADRSTRKKPIVVFGYGLATFARPLMAFAAAPWHVLAIRVADRIGKGVRSSPRDALIGSVAPPDQVGRAYGVHRAMDHAGAVVGPLCASALLALGMPLRYVFAAAIVPGVLSLVALAVVREPPMPAPAPAASTHARTTPLPGAFKRYLAIVGLFSIGGSTDAFLLLRAREIGVATALLPTLWVVLHISKLVTSYYGGVLADRVPRARLIVLGWTVYALAYLGFAIAQQAWQIWALFIAYGWYYGLTEPSEKAIVREIAPREAQGRAFGLYNFVVGISALPAGAITGVVWQQVSPQAALALGAAIAGAASLALVAWNATLRPGPER